MSDTGIRLAFRDHAAWITLDRPPLHILDIPANRALADAVHEAAARRDVRALVLRASGERAFSAGVEIADHVPERIEAMLGAFHDVFRALDHAALPLVAAVRGVALGGGAELVAFCDAVLSAESALFGFPEIALGCFAPVASIVLPEVVGRARAADLLLSGEPIGAREAQSIGLVTRVVPDGAVEAMLPDFTARYTRRSGAALRLAVEAMRAARPASRGDRFHAALAEVERVYVERLMPTRDAAEGIAAWREKRSAAWEDR
jgi:cyclohexa-1,5-dienecarbonyl-CoA hydratase